MAVQVYLNKKCVSVRARNEGECRCECKQVNCECNLTVAAVTMSTVRVITVQRRLARSSDCSRKSQLTFCPEVLYEGAITRAATTQVQKDGRYLENYDGNYKTNQTHWPVVEVSFFYF